MIFRILTLYLSYLYIVSKNQKVCRPVWYWNQFIFILLTNILFFFLLRAFPVYKAYETPVYFKSDWLNEFWDQRSDLADDYRFVYMGPKGSW